MKQKREKRLTDLYPYLFLIAFLEALMWHRWQTVALMFIAGLVHVAHRAVDAFEDSWIDDDEI